ncbi:MAG: phenylalanine--tRNA ligase subunit alpha [Candidatus Pacebacteria bacterium]|nr:phenylalanine--tRNA ligase subunit alpha [Candidatus Paceibacterota bacterium]
MSQNNQVSKGHQHPITIMIDEINNIFSEIGFVFASGPEIETEVYNFDRLNVAKDHPSRDMQDTFWLKPEDVKVPTVLRTHTSPVQAHYMESHEPPIRIIVPGKVFRNETTDATHEAEFYQFEGLYIDKDVNLGHLKGVLEYFLSRLFKGQTEIRFRPSYFPFVEPGLEVDMRIVGGDNKLSGRWIEIMGAGMVHPNVLRDSGIDPEKYGGFAFGVGVDRLVMMRHGIDDIRLLYSGDLRLVNQF